MIVFNAEKLNENDWIYNPHNGTWTLKGRNTSLKIYKDGIYYRLFLIFDLINKRAKIGTYLEAGIWRNANVFAEFLEKAKESENESNYIYVSIRDYINKALYFEGF